MVFVLDTNVLISAILLERSVSNRALQLAQKTGTIILSTSTKKELTEVIGRAKFDRYVKEELRQARLAFILNKAKSGAEINDDSVNCRDISDIKFLKLAIGTKVDCIISGDKDLLVLHPFRGIPILTPAQFLLEF